MTCSAYDRLERHLREHYYAGARDDLREVAGIGRLILDEDWLSDVISDSIDTDWTARDGANAIIKAMAGGSADNGWISRDEHDAISRQWRDQFDAMQARAMKAEAALSKRSADGGLASKCVSAVRALRTTIQFDYYDTAFPRTISFQFRHGTQRQQAGDAVDDAFLALDRALPPQPEGEKRP